MSDVEEAARRLAYELSGAPLGPSLRADLAVVVEAAIARERAVRAFREMPILSGASDKEPWVKLRIVDYTAAEEVLNGLDPATRVSVYCGASFDHGPHHYTENVAPDWLRPERVPHYCKGDKER